MRLLDFVHVGQKFGGCFFFTEHPVKNTPHSTCRFGVPPTVCCQRYIGDLLQVL
jgi:hypothetical protein